MLNLKVVTVIAVAVLLASCAGRVAPVHNVTDSPVVGVAGRTLTTPDVERAIKRAGSQLGWAMRTVKPGLIEATHTARAHSATVEIPFSQKSYSILYKTSANLKADGASIHQNYNGWIENLDRGIRGQLAN